MGDTALVVAIRERHDKIVQLICEQTDPDITVHVSMYMYIVHVQWNIYVHVSNG